MTDPLGRLSEELAVALAGLTVVQTQRTPPGRTGCWSIQQIVEHLQLSYQSTLEVLQARIVKQQPTRATPTLKQRCALWVLLSLGYFPHGLKAPPSVTPGQTLVALDGAELALACSRLLGQVRAAADQAAMLFADRRAASHIVLGPLSIPQWRSFHLVHGRHHLRQIRAIRNAYTM